METKKTKSSKDTKDSKVAQNLNDLFLDSLKDIY